jgi:hypothetical protein
MTRLLNANAGHASPLRAVVAVAFLLVLVYSSCSLRFADRHRKDDYRAAAAIAQEELAKGRRVWWAADALGAEYYGLPGEFDSIGELTGVGTPRACIDRTGVQSITGAPKECLEMLSRPNLVILSKPEIFDNNGAIAAYLATGNFAKVQVLPAFTIWRAPGS